MDGAHRTFNLQLQLSATHIPETLISTHTVLLRGSPPLLELKDVDGLLVGDVDLIENVLGLIPVVG